MAAAQTRPRTVTPAADAAPVLKMFEGRTTRDALGSLAVTRIPAFSADDKADILDAMSPRFKGVLLTDAAAVATLRQRLKPVLELHGREGALDVLIYHDDSPGTAIVPGAFIAFSTGLLDIARSDGELQAAAAHELAREYFVLPDAVANVSEDFAAARRYQTYYDAIAVASVLELGRDPAEYKGLLRKLQSHVTSDVGADERAEIDALYAARLGQIDRDETRLRASLKRHARGSTS